MIQSDERWEAPVTGMGGRWPHSALGNRRLFWGSRAGLWSLRYLGSIPGCATHPWRIVSPRELTEPHSASVSSSEKWTSELRGAVVSVLRSRVPWRSEGHRLRDRCWLSSGSAADVCTGRGTLLLGDFVSSSVKWDDNRTYLVGSFHWIISCLT